jgi:hypothetical protein
MRIRLYSLIIFILSLFIFLQGCKQENIIAITNITGWKGENMKVDKETLKTKLTPFAVLCNM